VDIEAFRAHNRARPRALIDKVTDEKDAVSRFFSSGQYLGIELYGTVRCPMSIVREMVRQIRDRDIRDLRVAGQGCFELELLVGTGAIKASDWTYTGLEVYGISPSWRRAVEGGTVETVCEWSNAAIAWRFKAAGMGVPFLPVQVMQGTDTLRWSSAVVVENPFGQGKVALVPALVVDLGVIHVHRADRYGNCQIDGISGFAREMARASRRLIVSAERIVDTEEIRAHPDRTAIPYFLVDAVVEAPFGSHPGEMAGLYVRDEPHIKGYYGDAKDPEEARRYVQEWIHDVPDHRAYLEKVGRDTLDALLLGKGGDDER
jgi:acyl CoA:acetate/3-ketoacid CoA transferase alpha subunit